MRCEHRGILGGGVCERCETVTCRFEVTGCMCAVGWPYDMQCKDCRDVENRMDQGYCVCRPLKPPPRSYQDV